MIKLVATPPTSTTLAVAMGAVLMSAQLQYPPRTEPYEIHQVPGTYSDFIENLSLRPRANEIFANQIATIYNAFSERQERLGAEFDAAIFGDLEGLYEM